MKSDNGIYTVLLALSLMAMATGSLLLLLDYRPYGSAPPPSVNVPAVQK
jgi:hypothetical protein